MHANRRRKDSQLTFRCNRKAQTIKCDLKEINMSYLEEYVLNELQKNIFSFHKVNAIMQVIRQHTENLEDVSMKTANEIEAKLTQVQKNQYNIIAAIEQGAYKEYFSQRLYELKEQEENLKAKLLVANQPRSFAVTSKEIMLLINNFQKARSERNFNELRKTILNFVEKIIITDENIEVILKITFGDVDIKGKNLYAKREKITEANEPITKMV